MREEFVMKTVDSVVVGGKCYQSYQVQCEYVWLRVGKLGSLLLLWVLTLRGFSKFGNIVRS